MMEESMLQKSFNLADLDTVGVSDARGNPTLRFGHYINFAHEGGDKKSKRRELVKLLEDYITIFGNKITHYFPYDSTQLKSISGFDYRLYFNTRAEMTDNLAENEGFEATVYGIVDVDSDEPPLYYADVSGDTKLRRFSSVDVYLPASWPETQGYLLYIETIKRWCNFVQPTYGTAGLSILFNEGRQGLSDRLDAFPIAKRFVGFDLPESARWFSMMGRSGRKAIRTVNWLTIINDEFVEELGGVGALASILGNTCPIHIFNGGIIIQAGEKPEIGDANQGLIPTAYQTVARALKKIRFEEYTRPLIDAPKPLDSLDETLRWVRRFD